MGLTKNLGWLSKYITADSTGKIGIGTASPNYGLNVVSSDITLSGIVSNRFIGLRKENNTLPGYLGLLGGDNGDSALIIGYNSAGTQTLQISASTLPTYFNGGNFGIGTSSPYTPLHIASTDPVQRFEVIGGVTNKRIFELRAIGASGYEGFQLRTVNDANNSYNPVFHVTQAGNVGIGTTSPAEKLTLDSGNIKLGTQGRVIFNRADNAIFTQLYDAGPYFVLDNRNGNGFDFQSAGTSHMRILPDGSINNKSVKTQYAAGYSDIGSTFYVDFVAYPSSIYKIMSGITHWQAAYGAYLETVQFNDSYTNVSNLIIVDHTSANGGSWSISRPNNSTIRVTHNAGTYAAYGSWWIEVIGT